MTNEESIEKIKGILEECTEDESSVCYVTSYDADALDMAIKALEQEPKTGHWIPVSERLPKNDDDVIITTGMGIYIGWFDANNHTWRLNDDYIMGIVAWMPLPEPYRAGMGGEE